MRVIRLVARHTFHFDFSKIIGDMAGVTRHQQVQANQRKARQIMVKSHIVSPTLRRVAGFAFGAKRAIMGIIFPMAANTGGCGFVLKNIHRMAAITARFFMLS